MRSPSSPLPPEASERSLAKPDLPALTCGVTPHTSRPVRPPVWEAVCLSSHVQLSWFLLSAFISTGSREATWGKCCQYSLQEQLLCSVLLVLKVKLPLLL